MKTEITPEEYKNIYEACDWNPKAFSIVLKRLGYSDELTVNGALDLYGEPIQYLVNVKEVKGYLNLWDSQIISLGNLKTVRSYLNLQGTPIQSLGSLKSVIGSLDIGGTKIDNFGDLKHVGINLFLQNTLIAKKYSEKQIRNIIKVDANIFLE